MDAEEPKETPSSPVSREITSPPTRPEIPDSINNTTKDMRSFERATLRWAKLAAIAGIAAAAFICFQWREMVSSSKDTHDLAVASKAQAEAVFKQAEATNRLAVEAKRSADVAEKALAQSAANTQLEQSAWVGVLSIPNTKPQIGQPLIIPVIIKNTGKTPAKNLSVFSGLFPFKKADRPIFPNFTKDTPASVKSRGVIVPNDERITEVAAEFLKDGKPTDGKITKDIIDLYNSGTETYYIYGKIIYDDIFDETHWTTFCYIYNPLDGYSTICAEHNNMDKRPIRKRSGRE